MRLIKQNIERKDGSGTATLLPEEPEDMVGLFDSLIGTSVRGIGSRDTDPGTVACLQSNQANGPTTSLCSTQDHHGKRLWCTVK